MNALYIVADILSITFPFAVCTLPMIIYRYTVKKGPLPPHKAEIVSLVYCVALLTAQIVISVLLKNDEPRYIAILFWSAVNCWILGHGYKKASRTENSTAAGNTIPLVNRFFCTSCGALLQQGSVFCSQCGVKADR